MFFLLSLFLCVNFLGVAFSQYFPPARQNVTVVKSKLRKDVSILFKEVGSTHRRLGEGPFSLELTTYLVSAGTLRDDTRSEVLCWLRESTSGDVIRCKSGSVLLNSPVFLVFRISKRPGKRSSCYLDKWRHWLFCFGGNVWREWTLHCQHRFKLDNIKPLVVE